MDVLKEEKRHFAQNYKGRIERARQLKLSTNSEAKRSQQKKMESRLLKLSINRGAKFPRHTARLFISPES